MDKTIEAPASARRARGRPARLSREAVLEKAMELLAAVGNVEELTMTRIAQELGAVPMALYTYFPNREALLEALSAETFTGFAYAASPNDPWQTQLRGWLQALQIYLQRFPHLRRSIGWNNEVAISSTWARLTLPVLDVMLAHGLAERRLALAFSWFVESAIGFLILVGRSPDYRQQMSASTLDHLAAEDRQKLMQLLPYMNASSTEELIELGFNSLINELERFFADAKTGA
ncbi:MAG TPA: TetR family transcriptional regulator [Spongiibacteraceae bacterium]|nr:TetR family transcriptional regulator [Spongiibacteraceae bacterium]